MRIGHSIFLVGAIPIAAAAAIAVAAVLLLNQADTARSGAVLAGAVYRDSIAAGAARDEFMSAQPDDRGAAIAAFTEATRAVAANLATLPALVDDPEHHRAVTSAEGALRRLAERMDRLVAVTQGNDTRLAEMAQRASRLVGLTDEARRRQQLSNTELAGSLATSDQRLRQSRRVVDTAHALRTVAADLERIRLRAGTVPPARLQLELGRLANTASTLGTALTDGGDAPARARLDVLVADHAFAFGKGLLGDTGGAGEGGSMRTAADRLIAWLDTLVKTNTTESDTLQAQMAELLRYSVSASETDQATQNIATEMLKVAEATGRALAARDLVAAETARLASVDLSERIRTLPISPLIQTEMLDALTAWRQALTTTAVDLRQQSVLVADMERAGRTMEDAVGSLNDLLIAHAEETWRLGRNLLIGAALFGLALAGALGIVVARSINRPLKQLQREMLGLVDGSHTGRIAGADRSDELGDMARATTYFVTELTRREREMELAKEAAHDALADLKRTQANLIQAEKLASLGQLVAGVAHEINTPLGVALTTATVVGPEVERFSEAAASGRLSRSSLDHFVGRMREGAQLLTANLERAAALVHSFKQVAVDQASGERRTFRIGRWLDDLLVSLGPVLKKAGHKVEVSCPDDFDVDGYPGALAQVLTNLIVNALNHAYPQGVHGTLRVTVHPLPGERFRIAFADDGRGIPIEHRSRVFDPFFTTGRSTGNTGLGLHIVYNLVTGRLGGRINLDTVVGHGTTFTIDLPRVAPVDVAEPETRMPRAAE